MAGENLEAFLRWYAPKAMREARALAKRWRVPSTVTPEDIAQELLLGVVQASREYDPGRGVDWRNFVLWHATVNAKRWIHRQRGALRLSGKARSRVGHSLDAMQDDGDGITLGGFAVGAPQEAEIDFQRGVQRIRAMDGGEDVLNRLFVNDDGAPLRGARFRQAALMLGGE